LKVNSASCWFLLYGCITKHGQQNIKFVTCNINNLAPRILKLFLDSSKIRALFV